MIKKTIAIFLIIALSLIVYAGAGTAFKCSFTECEIFPTYNMLTRAFANNKLNIENQDIIDTSPYNDKQYLYFGPLPAIVRLPFFLLFHQEISTGWMIAIYCAGIAVFFYLSICELAKELKETNLSVIIFTLTMVIIFNGYSLTMVSIPMIHSEAISAAMFFLMGAIYLYLRMRIQNFKVNYIYAACFGIFLAASFACRFSYIFAAAFTGSFFVFEYWRYKGEISKKEFFLNILIVLSIGTTVLVLLLIYNYIRFGAPLDFGRRDISSYSRYFFEQGYFRYDHIPYNLWNIFFRLPRIDIISPFIHIPGYIVEVKSVYQFMSQIPYRLINTNELSASVFLLLPITIFAWFPMGRTKFKAAYICQSEYIFFIAISWIQILMISITVATTIRYFYDFLPIMLLCSFIGIACLKRSALISNGFILAMGIFSIIISFTIFLNAISFYSQFVGYTSPALPYFFPK